MNRLSIVTNESDLIKLSDNRFKKQLLRVGEWFHGNAQDGKLIVTKEKLQKIVDNFNNRVIENVPIKKSHATNSELERFPELIAGYIENVKLNSDNSLDIIMNLDDSVAEILNKKYKNVSAEIDENYIDHETGELKGDVLRGVALVVEPYIKGLNPNFIALSEKEDKEVITFNLSKNIMEKEKKDKKELINLEEEEKKKEGQVEKQEEKAEDEKIEGKKEIEKESDKEKKEDEEKDEGENEEKEIEKEKKDQETENKKEEEVELSEVDKLKNELLTLKKQMGEEKKNVVDAKFQVLLSEGKITPIMEQEVKALMMNDSIVTLSEDEEKSIASIFEDLMEKMPNIVDFSEKGVKNVKTNLSEDEKEAFNFLKTSKEAKDRYIKNKENN